MSSLWRRFCRVLPWSLVVGVASGIGLGVLAVSLLSGEHDDAPGGAQLSHSEGAWGILERLPFTFEVDLQSIRPEECRDVPNSWVLPGVSAADVAGRLRDMGVPRTLADALAGGASCDAAGCEVRPDIDQVTALSRKARSRLFRELAANGANAWVLEAPIRTRRAFEASLESSGLPQSMHAQIEAHLVPWGRGFILAELAPICRGASDDVRRRVVRFYQGNDSALVRLLIRPNADVERLGLYWAGSRRTTSVRSLIRSLAKPPCGGRLDVGHMLPAFARERVNRLPDPDEVAADGLWFAIHFNRVDPRTPPIDPAGEAQSVARDWRPLASQSVALGDMLLFSAGSVRVAGVHIADDMLITRMGKSRFRPWALADRESVLRVLEPLGPVSIQAFRRRER